jgi:hypothetical protein
MILATLALGGALLGATAIAGVLMLYQLRATTDTENSAKAIFASDGGVEWALFNFYCSQTTPPRCAVPPAYPSSTFTNGATVDVVCYDDTNTPTPCYSTSTAATAISRGTSLDAQRTFDLTFSTGTLP